MPGRILIIDPVEINRIALNVKLSRACYDVQLAASLRDGVRMLRAALPDLLLISLRTAPTDRPAPAAPSPKGAKRSRSDPTDTALRLCRELRRWPVSADLPVIVLTDPDPPDLRLRALEAGATDVMAEPGDALLLARLRSLVRLRHMEEELTLRGDGPDLFAMAEPVTPFTPAAPVHSRATPAGLASPGLPPQTFTPPPFPPPEPPRLPARRASDSFDAPGPPPVTEPALQGRVALVGATPAQALIWQQALRPHLPWPLTAMTREQALTLADPARAPDLLVIAPQPEQGSALPLLAELRSRCELRFSKLLVTLPADQTDTAAMALDLGAAEVLADAIDPRELALRLRAQFARKHRDDRSRARLRDGLRAAYTDSLTGLYNRRYALEHLDALRAGSGGMRRGFAVLLLDLDRFKQINDRHGHPTGDRVLCVVADLLRANLRTGDVAARIGGDEFLVLLSETSDGAARSAAERLCARIAAAPVLIASPAAARPGPILHQTISVGVLPIPAGSGAVPDAASLIAAADQALYRAKRAGRNRVAAATQLPRVVRPRTPRVTSGPRQP